MAKRFTDTGKWDKAWFRKLPPEMKCVWLFLCDRCDHAGLWEIDDEALEFYVGADTSLDEILKVFGDKVCRVGTNKLAVTGFVDFQYGELNPESRVHKSVLLKLEKEGLSKGFPKSSKTLKDKDKDKDKEKEGECEGKLDDLYACYPLKKGKTPGLKKLRADLKAGATIEDMFLALERFIKHHRDLKTEKEFIPQFKTWATSWRDCLDPNYGQSEDFGGKSESLESLDLSGIFRPKAVGHE